MLRDCELGQDCKAGIVSPANGHSMGCGRAGCDILASWPVLQAQGADGSVHWCPAESPCQKPGASRPALSDPGSQTLPEVFLATSLGLCTWALGQLVDLERYVQLAVQEDHPLL